MYRISKIWIKWLDSQKKVTKAGLVVGPKKIIVSEKGTLWDRTFVTSQSAMTFIWWYFNSCLNWVNACCGGMECRRAWSCVLVRQGNVDERI